MGKFVDTGLLLAGDVFISEVLGVNQFGPAVGPINVSKLEATPPTTEEKSRTSNKRTSFGQTLDAVSVPKDPASLSITWDTASQRLLADAVAGKTQDYSAAAKTVTDHPMTLSDAGFIDIGDQHIETEGFSVMPSSGGDAWVVGTDIDVNFELGMIQALTEAAAVAVKVSYKTRAVTGTRITGATEITKPRRVMVDGINLATNQKVLVVFEHVNFSAKGATDLMKGDFVEGSLEGTLVTPAGKDAPWDMTMLD